MTRARTVLGRVVLVGALAACADQSFGPGDHGLATLHLALTLPAATPAVWTPAGETLHVMVRRAGQADPILDTSLQIGDSLSASFTVPLSYEVERFVATGEVRYGPLVLFLAFDAVQLRSGGDTSLIMAATYVGPGAGAAGYALGARDSSLEPGDTASLAPRVLDSLGQTISNVPVRYVAARPALLQVDTAGLLRAAASGAADTARVTGYLPMGLTSGLVVRVAPNIAPPVGVRAWVGGAGTTAADSVNWFNPANWSPAGLPASGDTIVIDHSDNDPVFVGADTVARLRVVGGALSFGGGTLLVTGDFSTEGQQGYVSMDRAADTLRVLGNAVFAGRAGEGMHDGVLYVGGDFSQPDHFSAFDARDNHRTVLNGTGPQRLSLAGASNGSQFRHLDITNAGGRILIGGEQELQVTGKLRVLTPVTIDNGSGGNGDVSLEVEDSLIMAAGSRLTVVELTLGGAMAVAGTFAPQAGGSFRVRFMGFDQAIQAGLTYGDVEVNGTARLSGATTFENLNVFGALALDGHPLTVTGALHTENGEGRLVMQSAADTLVVRGDAEFEGDTIPGLLTNGVLRIGGNFTQRRYSNQHGTFRASGNHRTILDGAGAQVIQIQDAETTFGHLDVSGGGTVGVLADRINVGGKFRVTTPVIVLERGLEPTVALSIGDSLVTVAGSTLNLNAIVVRGGVSILGTFTVSLVEFGGTGQSIPSLPYQSVTVTGSASLAGTINVAEGMWVHGSQSNLTLGGRKLVAARLSTGDGAGIGGSGTITMQNPADSIVLTGYGSFTGAATPGSMTAGVLIIGGDLYQTDSPTAFQPSGSHRTVLNGAVNQVIQFNNPGASGAASWFRNLELANTSGGIHLRTSVHVNGTLTATTSQPITVPAGGLNMHAEGVNVAHLDLDGITFAIGAGTIARFDSVTFRNQSPAATQLTIANPGAVTPHTFTGLRFLTAPSTGFYVSATDAPPADGNVLTLNLVNSQPVDGSARTVAAGGAVVNWIAPAVPLAFVRVSAGYRHSCGLVASGAAWCWGVGDALLNAFGDSTAGGRTTPGPVSGGLTFTTISTGDSHSCGLTPSGAAYCWGRNIRGSIGDGTLTNRPTPVAVAGGLQFVALEAGGHTTCALTAAGIAYCWGRNNYGEIGDGSLNDRTVPTPVSGGLTFSSISVSVDSRVCAITPAGAAWCWGHNSEGGVGDSSTTDRRTPVLVAGGLAFASLSTRSFDHTCAMTTDAQAYCWGRNANGELGDGTTTRRLTPTAVAGGQTFVALETGTFMTCALTGAGAAYCWGANDGGQLGDGTVTGRILPTPVTGGLTFSALRAGVGFAVALETGGAAWGWGYAFSNGRTTSSAVPVPLGPPVPQP